MGTLGLCRGLDLSIIGRAQCKHLQWKHLSEVSGIAIRLAIGMSDWLLDSPEPKFFHFWLAEVLGMGHLTIWYLVLVYNQEVHSMRTL